MKKIFISLVLLILMIVTALVGIYFYSLTDIERYIRSEFGLIEGEEKEYSQAFKEYEIFQCEFGVLNTEYVFVSHRDYSFRNEAREIWKTTFYSAVRSSLFSLHWNTQYTGGTDVKNTTFDELLAMLKEDCSQFQQSRGDYDDKTINWSYGAYEPEPERTQEEIEQKRIEAEIQEIKDIHYILEELYTDEMRQETLEEYGDWKNLSDDELYEWYLSGPGQGGKEAFEKAQENGIDKYNRKDPNITNITL